MGGILAELIEDISIRIAPVNRSDVMEMIKETKGCKILMGARGQTPKDIDSLADTLLKLSRLGRNMAQIREIDLNPVMSYQDGCLVLDARFIPRNSI